LKRCGGCGCGCGGGWLLVVGRMRWWWSDKMSMEESVYKGREERCGGGGEV